MLGYSARLLTKATPAPSRPVGAVAVIVLTLVLSACASAPRGGDSGPVTLLSAPVKNARVARGFGMWRHPILGYRRMHRGIDYAVRRGTPIYAAGNGVIEIAGWRGGYGRYIRIRHGHGIRTAYAHLSRIARPVRHGAQVKMGSVIGFSGSSGLSTGPHLHYEVWRRGVAIDPHQLDRNRQIVLRDIQLSKTD